MTEEYHRSMVFSIHRFIMRLPCIRSFIVLVRLDIFSPAFLKSILLHQNYYIIIFFAESLLFIIERRGGTAPLMTKVTSLHSTMKMNPHDQIDAIGIAVIPIT